MATDRDVVGSTFPLQWPSIQRLGKSRHLADYSTKARRGLVTEKYDGCNLAVTSRGVVASRRTVLISGRPEEDQLRGVSFQKVSLAKVAGMFDKLDELEARLKTMLPGVGVEEVVVYGELITKLFPANFDYGRRGVEKGDICVFGAGVAFADDTTQEQIDEALKMLGDEGFDAIVKNQEVNKEGVEMPDNEPKMAALFLNPRLTKLLKLCGFEEVVKQTDVAFPELAKLYGDKLVKGEIEGVVINFGGELLKWKGSTEEQHLNIKEVESARLLVDTNTYETWKAIAEASRRIEEESVNKKPDQTKKLDPIEAALIVAYASALTKMRLLDEHLEEGGKVEDYMKDLREEMGNDQPEKAKEKKAYDTRLPGFIYKQLKLKIGEREDSERFRAAMTQQMKDWMKK